MSIFFFFKLHLIWALHHLWGAGLAEIVIIPLHKWKTETREVYSDFPKATELSSERARIWIRVFGPHSCLRTTCYQQLLYGHGVWCCHVLLTLGKTGSKQFPRALFHEPGGHRHFPFVLIYSWTHIEAEYLKARIDLDIIKDILIQLYHP